VREYQYQADSEYDSSGFMGQKLTIPNRSVQSFSFWVKNLGSASGKVWMEIVDLADVYIVGPVDMGQASAVPSVFTKYTATCNTTINATVRLRWRWDSGGTGFGMQYNSTSVKASENFFHYSGAYVDEASWDCKYEYTYPPFTYTAPTDPLTRVNTLTRTFFSGEGGESIYTTELITGGVGTFYLPPVTPSAPLTAVEQ